MAQSSLFTRLKSIVYRNDAESLNTSSKRPRHHSVAIPRQVAEDKSSIVNTASARVSSMASRSVQGVIKAQAGGSTVAIPRLPVEDKSSIIVTASARVSSIASGGVSNIVKALAGSYFTLYSAFSLAERLSDFTKMAMEINTSIQHRARDAAKNTTYPTQTDLTEIAAGIANLAHDRKMGMRELVNRIDRPEGTHSQANPKAKKALILGTTARVELACAVVQIVEAHIVTIAQSETPVPSLEELLLAIHTATVRAAFGVAESITLAKRGLPPPYKEAESRDRSGAEEIAFSL